MDKKIAIILVDYNGLTDTIECIKSIEKTDGFEDIKIVVVDNASQKDEANVLSEQFTDIVTIRTEDNGGFAAGNNIGIEWALEHQYQYIILLNNDTIVDSKMVSALESTCDENTVSVPQMLYYSQPDTIWYGGGYINKKTGNAEHEQMNKKEHDDATSHICTFATGCCMCFSAETIKKVGLLDDSYFMYCEDTDYCIRLQKFGVKILYIPQAKLWHKISASTGGDESAFNVYYMTRNRIEVIRKYHTYFKWTAFPFTVITRYIRMLQMKKGGNPAWKAFVKGIHDGLNDVKGQADLSTL